MKRMNRIDPGVLVVACLLHVAMPANSNAQSSRAIHPDKARVVEHWTAERRAAAIPRDLVVDPRGLGYLRRPDGRLVPHGHAVAAMASQGKPAPSAAPGSDDTVGPTIGGMSPGSGATIGASHTFSADVSDPSGVKSVTFNLQQTGSSVVQSFAAKKSGTTNTWSVGVNGFADGQSWTWRVEAKDGAPRGGNLTISPSIAFTVKTSGGGGGSGNIVPNEPWNTGGAVQSASGRVYFEMPGNARKKTWWGYVCSGTVVTDDTSGRSIILTAAHCIYDDVNKAFARNVMFIPDQDGTTGAGTDRDCNNDPKGCWIASLGFVDVNWTVRKFPDNVAWDYGYYAVKDSGAHLGPATVPEQLDAPAAAGSLPIKFSLPWVDDSLSAKDYTFGIGYSYSDDPNLMYCAEEMTIEGDVNWWLPSCLLSGGSSGGPWIQEMSVGTGFGDIVSVNSWGYTGSPGMAGPKLNGTSASCIFEVAKNTAFPVTAPADGAAGAAVSCTP